MTTAAAAAASTSLAVPDTNIVSAILVGPRRTKEAELLKRYDRHLRGRSFVLSFVTVAELRFGAQKMSFGAGRLAAMEDWISNTASVVMPDNDLVNVYAQLRTSCAARGHGLADKLHEADRWIAATAIRHNLPLISDDRVFRNVPDLTLLQEPSPMTASSTPGPE
jgi:predicted nucleic acid-binding protein